MAHHALQQGGGNRRLSPTSVPLPGLEARVRLNGVGLDCPGMSGLLACAADEIE
jgi:hypothetical protein